MQTIQKLQSAMQNLANIPRISATTTSLFQGRSATTLTAPSLNVPAILKKKETQIIPVIGNIKITHRRCLAKQMSNTYGASFIPEWLAENFKKNPENAKLGRDGHQQFFMDAADALSTEGNPSIELPIKTGLAPFSRDVKSEDATYLLLFPTKHIEARKPTYTDASHNGIPHLHFCPLGKTGVKIESRSFHTATMQGVSEYVTEGGKIMPKGAILIKALNNNKSISNNVEFMQSW